MLRCERGTSRAHGNPPATPAPGEKGQHDETKCHRVACVSRSRRSSRRAHSRRSTRSSASTSTRRSTTASSRRSAAFRSRRMRRGTSPFEPLKAGKPAPSRSTLSASPSRRCRRQHLQVPGCRGGPRPGAEGRDRDSDDHRASPIRLHRCLKINLTTGEAIHEPQHDLEGNIERACAALTA
jgi:hypothetical protein